MIYQSRGMYITNSLYFASKVYAAQSGSGTEGGASGGAKKTTSN